MKRSSMNRSMKRRAELLGMLTVAALLTWSGFARPATGQEAAEPTVAITVGDPILVAQAPADLNRGGPGWGRWQFPMISRLADGRLLVTFTLEPDSYASYGKPRRCAVEIRGEF